MTIQAHVHDPKHASWFSSPAKDDMQAFASVTISSGESQAIVFAHHPEVLREIAAAFEQAANQLEGLSHE
jgi:hypothetical protein